MNRRDALNFVLFFVFFSLSLGFQQANSKPRFLRGEHFPEEFQDRIFQEFPEQFEITLSEMVSTLFQADRVEVQDQPYPVKVSPEVSEEMRAGLEHFLLGALLNREIGTLLWTGRDFQSHGLPFSMLIPFSLSDPNTAFAVAHLLPKTKNGAIQRVELVRIDLVSTLLGAIEVSKAFREGELLTLLSLDPEASLTQDKIKGALAISTTERGEDWIVLRFSDDGRLQTLVQNVSQDFAVMVDPTTLQQRIRDLVEQTKRYNDPNKIVELRGLTKILGSQMDHLPFHLESVDNHHGNPGRETFFAVSRLIGVLEEMHASVLPEGFQDIHRFIQILLDLEAMQGPSYDNADSLELQEKIYLNLQWFGQLARAIAYNHNLVLTNTSSVHEYAIETKNAVFSNLVRSPNAFQITFRLRGPHEDRAMILFDFLQTWKKQELSVEETLLSLGHPNTPQALRTAGTLLILELLPTIVDGLSELFVNASIRLILHSKETGEKVVPMQRYYPDALLVGPKSNARYLHIRNSIQQNRPLRTPRVLR